MHSFEKCKEIYFHVYELLLVCMYVQHMGAVPTVPRERVLNPLEPELQMVESQVLCKTNKCS